MLFHLALTIFSAINSHQQRILAPRFTTALATTMSALPKAIYLYGIYLFDLLLINL